MKKFFLALVLALGVSGAFAQYETEVLNYTQKIYMSDARSTAVGNAFSAVGANLISTSINPAGLAFFRKSEFTFSNSFYVSATNSEYLGTSDKSHKANYNIPSLGFVFTEVNKVAGKPVKEGWVNYNFAATLNRTNNFHQRSSYIGVNTSSSYLDYFAEQAQGSYPSQLNYLSWLAYEAYLIDNPDSMNPTVYYTAIDTGITGRNVQQSINTRTSGATYDLNFSFAANYSNFIYLGATIGIPTINYNKSLEFAETNLDPNATNYISSVHTTTLNVDGVGINAGLGMIVKPSKFFRFGGSIQTPTIYRLNESYDEEMVSSLLLVETDAQNLFGSFKYSLTTPFRATLGAALFLGKIGFISVDYEYLDYSMSFYDSDDFSMMDANNNIEDYYGSAGNLRVGAELKYKIFAFRGGYNIYQSPYKDKYRPELADGSKTITSFGLGIREKAYYFDVAYQLINAENFYLPYSLQTVSVEGAKEEVSGNNVILTLGLHF